jgi:four helix bundle suffix protein
LSDNELLIPPHGGYKNLKSFQVSQLVYDLTVRFCDKFIDKNSRTHDQMVQAARSGVQNIAEGSQASGASKKFELKLTSVARASLEELKLDYEDFLRQRRLSVWTKDEPLKKELVDKRFENADDVIRWIKEKSLETGNRQNGRNGQSGQKNIDKPSIESTKSIESTEVAESSFKSQTVEAVAANSILVLISVACFLLDRQISRLAEDFEKEGGFTERLYRVRSAKRKWGK